MLRIRPVTEADIKLLPGLTQGAGAMTTLPKTEEGFRERVESSTAAFQREDRDPRGETFFMVLEDHKTGELLGTTAIYTNLGAEKAFYNYRLTRIAHYSYELGIQHLAPVLMLANDFTGATELGTLFLAPAARGKGASHLLSRCRFMLMALRPEKFDQTILAEMRGWLDDDGTSPFWEALGKHFFHLPFDQADNISGASNNQFIADLMPQFPVYVDILPKRAQEVIAVPHRNAAPAYELLKREGLRFNNAVDIFDAGPVLDAPLDQIRTVQAARTLTVAAIDVPATGTRCLIAKPKFADFRCVQTAIGILAGDEAILTAETAAALDVKIGDAILVVED